MDLIDWEDFGGIAERNPGMQAIWMNGFDEGFKVVRTDFVHPQKAIWMRETIRM